MASPLGVKKEVNWEAHVISWCLATKTDTDVPEHADPSGTKCDCYNEKHIFVFRSQSSGRYYMYSNKQDSSPHKE